GAPGWTVNEPASRATWTGPTASMRSRWSVLMSSLSDRTVPVARGLSRQPHFAGIANPSRVQHALERAVDIHAFSQLFGQKFLFRHANAMVVREHAPCRERGAHPGPPDCVIAAFGVRAIASGRNEGEINRATVRIGMREVSHHQRLAPDRLAHGRVH